MSTDATESAADASLSSKAADQILEERRNATRARRAKLVELGPQFVQIMRFGQGFTRFTPNTTEDIFLWYDPEDNRGGALCWEPLVELTDEQRATLSVSDRGMLQPKQVSEANTMRLYSVSDIFMGRTNEVFRAHMDKVPNPKLCMSFAAYDNVTPPLHILPPLRSQMETWIYGIQHLLKQDGYAYVEADERTDRAEQAVFEKYTAKQLVRLITKSDPEVAALRISATLTAMNRGQAFTRYYPDGVTEEIKLFYCYDGHKGTLFWGPRNAPEGYLSLRAVTDMWLGKHGLLLQEAAASLDSACCVTLASKRAVLALAAPTRDVMSRWVYGVHTLLTASPELIKQLNEQADAASKTDARTRTAARSAQQQTSSPSSAAAAAAKEAAAAAASPEGEAAPAEAAAETAAETAVDPEAEAEAAKAATAAAVASGELDAAAMLAALQSRGANANAGAAVSAGDNNNDEDDDADDDADAVAAADEIEAEMSRIEAEMERARHRKQLIEKARKEAAEREEAAKNSVAQAGSAATDALAQARYAPHFYLEDNIITLLNSYFYLFVFFYGLYVYFLQFHCISALSHGYQFHFVCFT